MFHSLFITYPLHYLDPGSGSFIIQMLVAGFLGASLAFSIFWKKIKSIFSGNKESEEIIENEINDENKPD